MSENHILEIPEKELEEILNFSSKKIVGKMMKRFEIHDNVSVLKKEMKELAYEGMRDFRDLLIASGHGLGLTTFEFKKGETHSA